MSRLTLRQIVQSFAITGAAARGARTAQAHIGIMAKAGPAALHPGIGALCPMGILKHQRQPGGKHKNSARTGNRADDRRQDDDQDAEHRQAGADGGITRAKDMGF